MSPNNEERMAKRDKFNQPQKGKNKQKLIISLIVVAFLGYVGWNFFGPAKDPNATNGVGGTWYVAKSFAYGSQEVQQTKVENIVENGKIKISKQDVNNNKIVYTEYKKGDKIIPLTAYVNLKGRVIAAVSMCEPCKGQRFRVAVDQLVCNTCNTRWKLTSLEGISGAPECYKYPPEELRYEQDGDYITLDENKIANWQPRV